MALKKYIKGMLKPAVAKRAKAMKKAKRARTKAGQASASGRLDVLEENLSYKFKKISILQEALTHPGTVGVSKEKVRSNQRLEFLGDAVLQAIISDTVFKKFQKEDEGELTKIRIAFTQGTFLSELSAGLGIPQFLIIPKGGESIRQIPSAAEDAIEAVIGAIFLDSDFDTARKTVLSWYKRKLESLPDLVSSQNPKGHLQEMAARRGSKVEYVLISQDGPDHQKTFEIELRIGGVPYARARANSKKLAESKAARLTIQDYGSQIEAESSQTQDAEPSKKSKKSASK